MICASAPGRNQPRCPPRPMSKAVTVSGPPAAKATPHVSEIPFAILSMTAGQARDISRSWQRVAKRLLDSAGKPREVRLAERRAQWWLAYAIALRRVAVGVHPDPSAVEMRAVQGGEGIGMSPPQRGRKYGQRGLAHSRCEPL